MPVPTLISDLDTNAANNSPPGTESAKGNIDNYLRAAFAFIKQVNNMAAGATATLPSASTVAIGAAAVNNIIISGTTTISAFDSIAEGALRYVIFSGALTLTHNATSLALPGAANIATAANDTAIFKSLGGGNWQCMFYQRASGAVVGTTGAFSGALSAASATFSGGVTAATPATGNRSTSVATTQMFANEFINSLVTNGYQKLPNGLIIQWGQASTTGSGITNVTFPIAFPSTVLAAVANPISTGTGTYSINVANFSSTIFTALTTQNNVAIALGFGWLAVGF